MNQQQKQLLKLQQFCEYVKWTWCWEMIQYSADYLCQTPNPKEEPILEVLKIIQISSFIIIFASNYEISSFTRQFRPQDTIYCYTNINKQLTDYQKFNQSTNNMNWWPPGWSIFPQTTSIYIGLFIFVYHWLLADEAGKNNKTS